MSDRRIRVFVTDIDGCLTLPYEPFDASALQQLSDRAGLQGGPPAQGLPQLTICSGRPSPYVEAMTQLLGVRLPVLFEAGGGMFDPAARTTRWHPSIDSALAERIDGMKKWMVEKIIPGTSLSLDYGKRTQVSVTGPDREQVEVALVNIENWVSRRFDDMIVAHTDVSVDVIPRTTNKEQGLRWLARVIDVDLQEMAYIGDTNGDIDALRIVGRSFAPANATAAVKSVVDVVTGGAWIHGVLEAYESCGNWA